MIEFHSQNGFELLNRPQIITWLTKLVEDEQHSLGILSFVFCDDDFLHRMNVDYLGHDTLTDIITFDYVLGKEIHGEVYISTERVTDNAKTFQVDFYTELYRVLAHGVLHLCGYKDKTKEQAGLMRSKEDLYISQISKPSA